MTVCIYIDKMIFFFSYYALEVYLSVLGILVQGLNTGFLNIARQAPILIIYISEFD